MQRRARSRRSLGLAVVVSLGVGVSACGGSGRATPPPPASPPPAAGASPAIVYYPIRGKVVDIAADRKSVTLDHEDIPGLMPAMEMELGVTEPSVLEGLEPGMMVEGDLRMRGRGAAISRLVKRGASPGAAASPGATPSPAAKK